MSEVFQDNALLNDTIENNIRIGKSEATMEEIIKAAKIAHAHEFIIEMEKGYKHLYQKEAVLYLEEKDKE